MQNVETKTERLSQWHATGRNLQAAVAFQDALNTGKSQEEAWEVAKGAVSQLPPDEPPPSTREPKDDAAMRYLRARARLLTGNIDECSPSELVDFLCVSPVQVPALSYDEWKKARELAE